MTERTAAESVPPRRRVRPSAVILLVLTAALAFLVMNVSYGLALEYGDTAATDARIVAQSFRDWGIGIVLVVGLSAWAIAAARRSRGRRAMTVTAAVAAVVTLVGVPAGAVLGVQRKFERYPDLPSCTDGFGTGPAVPVVRAAQAGFAELDHPGPFSGGGSSGIDGCSSQLMVHQHVDVPAAYRHTLVHTGWRISPDGPDLLAATKNGDEFEASRDQDGSWWVRIGPAGLQSPATQPGEVTPRR
ncbi:MAG: hypothetical protein ACRDWY_14175 [Actinomycetes bacterium]